MKVVRTSLWINPVYDQKMKAEPGIALDILDVKGDPEVGWKQLGQAHVYQIAATKDDLPKPFFAHQELIERCPNLLVVSSNGADRKSTRLNSSHIPLSRMPSSA